MAEGYTYSGEAALLPYPEQGLMHNVACDRLGVDYGKGMLMGFDSKPDLLEMRSAW
jgi:hypothetical protein